MGQSAPQEVPDLLEQLSHTSDGVFAIDLHHHIILWNQGAETLLGYKADEVLGRYCHEVLRARDASGKQVCSAWCRDFQQAIRKEWPHHKRILASTRDGRDIWIDVSTLTVLSPRQELSSLVHIFRNSGEPLPFARKTVETTLSPPDSRPIRRVEKPNHSRLTKQERVVLRYLAEGISTEGIADRLFISPVTVRNHIQKVLEKLGVHSRLEAVAFALRGGLIGAAEPPSARRSARKL